jgi:hypothetical protein
VQLGEELDAILAREQLIHYPAEMIATKAKGKNVWTQLLKSCQKLWKVVKKLSSSCQKVGKKLVIFLKRSEEEDDRDLG